MGREKTNWLRSPTSAAAPKIFCSRKTLKQSQAKGHCQNLLHITCNSSSNTEKERCCIFLLWKGTCSCCTKVKLQTCGRIWDMPQLSDRKSASASSGMCTLRQISNPVLPVRPTAQGESDFPTQSSAACSYCTGFTKPSNAVKAPILHHQHGPLHSRERLYGTCRLAPTYGTQKQTQQLLKRNICNHLPRCWEASLIRQPLPGLWNQTGWETWDIPGRPGTSSYGTDTFCPGWQACRTLIFTLLATIIPPENGITKPSGVYVQPQQPAASCSLETFWR